MVVRVVRVRMDSGRPFLCDTFVETLNIHLKNWKNDEKTKFFGSLMLHVGSVYCM